VRTFLSRSVCIVCFISLFITTPALAAQDQSTPSPEAAAAQGAGQSADTPKDASVELNKAYFKGYVTDLKSIVTSPARWDTTDWITATVVTGVAVGLYDNDAKIQKWVLDHKTGTTDNVGKDATSLGFGKFTPVLIGGMYVYGHFADDGKMRKTALLSAESFVLTGVFVQALKVSTGRHRPYTGDPPHTWEGHELNGSGSTMSFPSGHASSAFAIATVIASEYDNYVVPPLAYGVAAITALNRLSHNAHWSSDTFVGSAIGYFTGKAVVASHRNRKEARLSFAPMINDGDLGVIETYRF
jgi:membrane-associated phospholipid phosphatase